MVARDAVSGSLSFSSAVSLDQEPHVSSNPLLPVVGCGRGMACSPKAALWG